MRETGTPIWIGEFGPVYPGEDEWRYRLLRDQLEMYQEHGASWALWTYKDIGLQGLAYTKPDSPYLDHIRLFDREFPDYQPWPWGRKQHIALLVRHILLAEPLALRYAELWRGITPERARELAASFRLDQCDIRTGLAELLSSFGPA